MAKRRFQLPREEELSKEQDSVLALPEDGQYLIIGGPGTGKSVVALLRAMKYYRPNNSRFLTYNKVLRAATEQLVNFPKPDDAMTINSWFFRSYQRIFGRNQRLPEKQRFVYDYEKVVDQANRIPEQRKQKWSFFHLIIDEGQDMPIGFYRSLMELGLENFFIVADQNQQITELNSSRQELTAVLALQASEVLELTQNYRNSRPIAAFAGYFHTDKASPPPMLPDRPSLDTPLLFEYTREQDCISLILRESDKDAGRLIGVIVANNEIRKRYVKVLQSLDIALDNTRPTVSTYPDLDNNRDVNIVFSRGGVVVLNAASVKGLEFDTVFVVLDGFRVVDETDMKKKLYVMTSRAIDRLLLLKKSGDGSRAIEALLPADEMLLRREKLTTGSNVQAVQMASGVVDFDDEIIF